MNPIRQLIRQIINETFLQEDYESIQEIRVFANEVLVHIARVNLNEVVRWATEKVPAETVNEYYFFGGGERPLRFHPVSLHSVFQYASMKKKYNKLAKFLDEAQSIYVQVLPEFAPSLKGNYSYIDDKQYDKFSNRTINLFYPPQFEDDLKQYVKEKYDNGKNLSVTDLYTKLYYPLISTAIHEIQHAYDDFRSNSKMYQTKDFDTFRKLEKELSNKEEKDKQEFNKLYLNLTHEIWARFSQAMDKVRFSEAEFAKTPDGKDYFKSSMRPFKKVFSDFRYQFDGYHILTDDMKKRLIRKLAQFWNMEQDKIEKENKNPETFE